MFKAKGEAQGFQYLNYMLQGPKGSVLPFNPNIKELKGSVSAVKLAKTHYMQAACNVQHPFSLISVVGPVRVQVFRGMAGSWNHVCDQIIRIMRKPAFCIRVRQRQKLILV